MSEEKLTDIYKYLKKYIEQRQEHDDYIDYYELYDLDRNMTIEQLKDSIKNKKIRVLFHPDQIGFIEDYFKQSYLENTEEVVNMINTFSNDNFKKKYDDNLTEKKKPSSNITNHHTTKPNFSDIVVSKEDEEKLERVVETTIYKHGFYHGFASLQSIVKYENYDVITKDNNARALASELGNEKIKAILQSKREDIMEDRQDNIIMDYYLQVINKSGLKEKADIFYDACLNTSLKYDVSQNISQLSFALENFINYSKINNFTNYHGSRDNLNKSNINPGDAYILMMAKIHSKKSEDDNNSYTSMVGKTMDDKISAFSEIEKKEAIKIKGNNKK